MSDKKVRLTEGMVKRGGLNTNPKPPSNVRPAPPAGQVTGQIPSKPSGNQGQSKK